jgi:hypothetical protein
MSSRTSACVLTVVTTICDHQRRHGLMLPIVRLVPIPRPSFPFGVPAYLAIIGRRQGFIRAVVRGRANEGLRTDVMPTARQP